MKAPDREYISASGASDGLTRLVYLDRACAAVAIRQTFYQRPAKLPGNRPDIQIDPHQSLPRVRDEETERASRQLMRSLEAAHSAQHAFCGPGIAIHFDSDVIALHDRFCDF